MRVRLCLLVALIASTSAIAGLLDQFTADGLTVRFTSKAEDDIRGTLELAGKQYPFTATRSGTAAMAGSFTASGKSFKFTLTADGAGAILETGGAKYQLTPNGAAPQSQPQPDRPGADRPADARHGPSMTYIPQKITDAKTNMDVATLLVPQGWKVEPGVLWRARYAQFVSLGTSIYDPERSWAARWLPHDQFIIDPVLYQNAINQGGNPMTVGGIEYAPRPMDAATYVQNVVLPRYRKVEGLTVVQAEDLPRMAEIIDRSQPQQRELFAVGGRELMYSAARVRIEYPGAGGKTLQEDIFAVLNISWSPQANANARSIGAPEPQNILCDRITATPRPRANSNRRRATSRKSSSPCAPRPTGSNSSITFKSRWTVSR
jgi:hypothetical protein